MSIKIASNHWELAVETHGQNHPNADHMCADLSAVDPRRFPRTDILWASPECTNHSVAKGRKRADAQPDLFGDVLPDAAAERSRATMWDVPRFAEVHRYQAVIVENVVDAWHWEPYRAWLMAMDCLGYEHEVVFLNSMHAQAFGPGAPQSRDRMYVVFWRKGNARPNIERATAPAAVCPDHGVIQTRQAFKRPDRRWGRYRQQYVYICGTTGCQRIVEPMFRPAAEIIDWELLGQRIGDRDKPLADKTLARIRAGIEKYWAPLISGSGGGWGAAATPVTDPGRTMLTREHYGLAVPVEGRDGKAAQALTEALRTQTTRNETGLAFIAELRGGGSVARPVVEPLATVTAAGNHHGLVTTYYGNGSTKPTGVALDTVTTVERHALLMRNNKPRGNPGQMVTPASEAARTITTTGHQSLLTAERPTIDVDDVLFRMLEPREIAGAMDFPADYVILGNRREQVRQAGNAVTPPAARDLVGIVAESLGVSA